MGVRAVKPLYMRDLSCAYELRELRALDRGHGPEWLSTRIRQHGKVDACHLTGVSARADWFVHQHRVLKKHGDGVHPRVIFVSTRMADCTFPYFVTQVLPQVHAPVVVVLGSDDCTFPVGLGDVRAAMRPFARMQEHVLALVCCELVVRIFVENVDWLGHPKLVALPLGVLPYGPDMRFGDAVHLVTRLTWAQDLLPQSAQSSTVSVTSNGSGKLMVVRGGRRLRVFCAHRVHDSSPQWDDRRTVSALCVNEWVSFTTSTASTLSHTDFMDALYAHDFVLCVHGGGIDPSPRAWEALLAGCIPIMARSTLSSAYALFPCVIVDAWTPDALSESKLEQWWQMLRQHYEMPAARQAVLQKLTLDYWWSIISESALTVHDAHAHCIDKFVFLPDADVPDAELAHMGGNVLENAMWASKTSACVAFNTSGSMKYTLQGLHQRSKRASRNAHYEGIFIKESAYARHLW